MVMPENPYSPTTSFDDLPILPSDTEFLVSDSYVAAASYVRLPDVCILSGETTSLLRSEQRFRWSPRWIAVTRNFVVGVWCSGLISELTHWFHQITRIAQGTLPSDGRLIFVFALTGLSILTTLGAWVLRQNITVSWCISPSRRARIVRTHLRNQAIILAVLAVLMILSGMQNIPGLLVIAVVSGIASALMMRASVRPKVLGMADGLFILGNFSPEFLRKVHRMIEAWNAQQKKQAVSLPAADA